MENRPEAESSGSQTRQRRRKRSRSEVFAIVKEFRDSGLSQRAFCGTRNIPLSTLTSWLKKTRNRSVAEAERKLIPIRITAAKSETKPLEIVLANDRVIRIQGNFDPDLLAKLLSVAESPC